MKNKTINTLPTIPNEKYQKFFAKFQEITSLDVSSWKVVHLLGYFCHKYKELYQTDYSWKFNNPSPFKCFEVWQINVLCSKLSANPKILKEYIDWVFQTEIPKIKTKFRSISFLTQEDRIIYYKMNVLLATQNNSNINRSTVLPTIYQDLLKNLISANIATYGDLAFLSQMIPLPDNISYAFKAIEQQGFNLDILKKII